MLRWLNTAKVRGMRGPQGLSGKRTSDNPTSGCRTRAEQATWAHNALATPLALRSRCTMPTSSPRMEQASLTPLAAARACREDNYAGRMAPLLDCLGAVWWRPQCEEASLAGAPGRIVLPAPAQAPAQASACLQALEQLLQLGLLHVGPQVGQDCVRVALHSLKGAGVCTAGSGGGGGEKGP